jgi:hypothetical protein
MPVWLTARLVGYAAGVLAVVVAVWLAYDFAFDRGVAAERARWERATAEAGERFAAALAEQQAVIAELDRDLTDARARANRRREGLSNALQNDPAAGDWGRQPIPDSVRAALGRDRDLPDDPGRTDRALPTASARDRD